MVLKLALTALFIALNAVFVAAEFSLVKLRATQLQRLARRNTPAARATVEICARLERYLSATQIGVTLASLGLGYVGEPAVAGLLGGLADELHLGHAAVHEAAFILGFAALTFLHVLLGELLPKLIAIGQAEKIALALARPLRFFYLVALPGLALLNGASKVLLRALGFPSLAAAEGALSEEEILGVLGQAYARGRLSEAKRLLLERVMAFSDRTVRQVMVPRLDVVCFDADTAVDAAIARASEQGFTRYPVADGGDLDKIVGYVNIKDVVLAAPRPASLRKVTREVMFVPETLGLFDVMRDMQRRQLPLAVVVDEYGGTSGIATLEDVLEEIVGEIRDEHDQEAPRVEVRPDGSIAADGLATPNDLRSAGVDVGELDADTVGGAVLAALGRLARPGDLVRMGSYEARVDTVRKRRVARVLLRKVEDPTEDEEGAG